MGRIYSLHLQTVTNGRGPGFAHIRRWRSCPRLVEVEVRAAAEAVVGGVAVTVAAVVEAVVNWLD